MTMVIPNQKQALADLEKLRPVGEYRGGNQVWPSEITRTGKIKKHAARFKNPRPVTIAGNTDSPPTSPDFGGTGLKVMGS
jgi:hypothetical protein